MIVVGENRVIPTLVLPHHKLEFQLSTTILLPYSCGKSAYRLRNSTFEDRFWESLVEPIINLSRTYMCIIIISTNRRRCHTAQIDSLFVYVAVGNGTVWQTVVICRMFIRRYDPAVQQLDAIEIYVPNQFSLSRYHGQNMFVHLPC